MSGLWKYLRARATEIAPTEIEPLRGPSVLGVAVRSNVDIVLIHDLGENRDDAWESRTLRGSWLQVLQDKLNTARIVTWGYDTSKVKELGDMFDMEYLQQCATKLLYDYPLRSPSASSSTEHRGEGQGEESAIAPIHTPVRIEKPVIFVAHGYGGLVYEQALVRSNRTGKDGKRRQHAALLFDTPHHAAGLAEWAILCAQQMNLPCQSTAQKQKWEKYQNQIWCIHSMQVDFRRIIRNSLKINIAACYATKFESKSKLRISPEWVVLPDFEPIAIDRSHYEMTKLRRDDPNLKRIVQLLQRWVSELSSASTDNDRPLSPHNPLVEMRKILGNSVPQANPWAPWVRVQSFDAATWRALALGNIISFRNQRPRLHVSAVDVLASIPHSKINEVKESIIYGDELLRQQPLHQDVALWVRFTESLSGSGLQFASGGNTTAGQASSKIREFSEITTREWKPDKTYASAASKLLSERMKDVGPQKLSKYRPFRIVVGIKTVRGHHVQRNDPTLGHEQRAAEQQSKQIEEEPREESEEVEREALASPSRVEEDQSDGEEASEEEQFPSSAVPEELAIAFLLEDVGTAGLSDNVPPIGWDVEG